MFNNPKLLDRGNWKFELCEDLRYKCTILDIVVPTGFVSNLATTPRVLWSIVPPYGPWAKSSIVHDYLYSDNIKCPRLLADTIFLHCMKIEGTSFITRHMMYLAVRSFGWLYYTEPKI